jgi:hypothetical protein
VSRLPPLPPSYRDNLPCGQGISAGHPIRRKFDTARYRLVSRVNPHATRSFKPQISQWYTLWIMQVAAPLPPFHQRLGAGQRRSTPPAPTAPPPAPVAPCPHMSCREHKVSSYMCSVRDSGHTASTAGSPVGRLCAAPPGCPLLPVRSRWPLQASRLRHEARADSPPSTRSRDGSPVQTRADMHQMHAAAQGSTRRCPAPPRLQQGTSLPRCSWQPLAGPTRRACTLPAAPHTS